MRLRSRLVDDEQREASYQKFRVGSLESSKATSGQLRQSGVLKDRSPSQSPSIAAKDMTEELPFEMDEDTPKRRLPSSVALPPPRPPSTIRRRRRNDVVDSRTDARNHFVAFSMVKVRRLCVFPLLRRQTRPLPLRRNLGQVSMVFGASATPLADFSTYVQGIGTQKTSWPKHLQVAFSSLTQSLKQAEASSKAALRVSQKERKRQAQLQKTQAPRRSRYLGSQQPQKHAFEQAIAVADPETATSRATIGRERARECSGQRTKQGIIECASNCGGWIIKTYTST